MLARIPAPAPTELITFVLAVIGAYTVGKYVGEAINAHRFMAVPNDVRRLT